MKAIAFLGLPKVTQFWFDSKNACLIGSACGALSFTKHVFEKVMGRLPCLE